MAGTAATESRERAASFVGRAAELERLHLALTQTAAGRGRVVVLVGEAGIGKTRIAAEFATQARAADALVLRGGCYEGEWTPPYGPIVEALTAYIRADPVQLPNELGFGAAPLTRLLPALRERLPDIPEPIALQPDEERFRLFDAVSQFLIAIATTRTVVLLLDDLHWADRGTIALLRHVARFAAEHRLLLIGAYRDVEVDASHPLAELLGVLRRESSYDRVLLKGLDHAETGELITAVAQRDLADAVVSNIHRHTRGNPFFVRETVQHLIEEGRLTEKAALPELTVPEGIRHVVERRLARLSAEANRLLTVASAFDGPFRHDIAAVAANLELDPTLGAIDEALQTQIIQPTAHADTYDFGHALIRQTLYTALSPSRRTRLHRQIAEAMERLCAESTVAHAAAIAQQYYHSKDLPGAERGVSYALVAAQRAEAAYAYDDTATFLRIALELLPQRDPRYARILGRLGLALPWVFAFEEAARLASEAGRLLAEAEGADAAADYLGEATFNLSAAGAPLATCEIARQGMQYIGSRRDLTWLRLAGTEVPRREREDPDYPGIPLDSPERREMSRVVQSLSLDDMMGSMFVFPIASREEVLQRWRENPIYRALLAGEFRPSAEIFADLSNRYEREGRIDLAANMCAGVAVCRLALGNMVAADEAWARGAALSTRLPGRRSLAAFVLASVRFTRCLVTDEGWTEFMPSSGNRGEEPRMQPLWEPLWAQAALWAAGAVVRARLGYAEAAMELLALLPAALDRAPAWAPSYAALACDAVTAMWDLQHTAQIERLERNVREKVIAPDFRNPMHEGRFALARLCALQRRYEEAVHWFANARTVLDEQGARPLRAIVDYDEAVMYARRGADGDRERSVPLLEAAMAQFRAIGMPGWIRRAEHLRATGTEWTPEESTVGSPRSAVDDPRRETRSASGDQGPGTGNQSETCSFRCEGDVWAVTFAGATHRIKDSRGLRYLALLFAHPGREFHAAEIVALSAQLATNVGIDPPDTIATDLGDAGAVLDATATVQYKRRLESLREELREAEANNDLGRGEHLRAELAALISALAAGQRGRRAASHAERARSAVSKRIHAALKQITAVAPKLGRYLNLTVRTGNFCSYQPTPMLRIDAQL